MNTEKSTRARSCKEYRVRGLDFLQCEIMGRGGIWPKPSQKSTFFKGSLWLLGGE